MARRLLATYLTITALALAVIVIPLGQIFAERETDRLVVDIERDAQVVASLSEDALESGGSPDLSAALEEYGSSGGRVIVVDEAGISVADSDDPAGDRRDFSTRPEISAALDGQRTSGTRPSETVGGNLMYVAVPVASSGVVHGAVRITYPTSTLDARVRETWIRLGALSLVVLGLVAAVGMIFARGVTRPLRRLQQAAGHLAAGELRIRVDTDDGPPELRSLAETFNATAQQLELLVASQQRFVADASHQLRTPLTALRLRLETLEPFIADEARPRLEAAVTETDRLARLVHSMLVLARNDAATPVIDRIDLTETIAGRVETWSAAAADQGVLLVTDCPRDVWVQAVPGALEQILDNLLSNALDVVPEHTRITIRVALHPDVVELHVIDQGPGMSEEARSQAFERFWRPARSAGASQGFGLGLAIVRELADRCGGSARLERGPGIGLDAVITLRLAEAPRAQSEARPGPAPIAVG